NGAPPPDPRPRSPPRAPRARRRATPRSRCRGCRRHPRPGATGRFPWWHFTLPHKISFMDTPNLDVPVADEGLAPSLLLAGLRALRKGDFSVRLPQDRTGIAGEIAHAFNEAVEMSQSMQIELARISRVVGKDGKLAQRAQVTGHAGGWRDCIESVNALIDDLVQPTHEVARVIGGVAAGDLSQKMLLDVEERRLKGEFLSNAKVVNGMGEQLAAFAAEGARVARRVG